jgi:hypothetical protein
MPNVRREHSRTNNKDAGPVAEYRIEIGECALEGYPVRLEPA